MEIVHKPWGNETWLELNDKYCYKRIFFKAGHKCSLQYHEKKLETIYVESGEGFLYLENGEGDNFISFRLSSPLPRHGESYIEVTKIPIQAGQSFTIQPGTIHRVEAVTDLTTLEVSTPEVDDCIRINDEWNRPNGKIESEHEI